MDFRLFPHPEPGMCTPYADMDEGRHFGRLVWEGERLKRVKLDFLEEDHHVRVTGADEARIVGARRPDRARLIEYCDQQPCDGGFLKYVLNTVVVPTFSYTIEEAFVRAVIKQVIRASHAKRLISEFIRCYGRCQDGWYAFPRFEDLAGVSCCELRKMGLGFKAERLLDGLMYIAMHGHLEEIKGIGKWSRSILAMEECRDFASYPFDDMSVDKIEKVCGLGLRDAAQENRALAGDLYLYAASFLEARL